jgi:hypothetical protein
VEESEHHMTLHLVVGVKVDVVLYLQFQLTLDIGSDWRCRIKARQQKATIFDFFIIYDQRC